MAAATKAAEKAFHEGPFSVMQKTIVPPSGDKHDYMSQAPYFWADPSKPNGLPYIQRLTIAIPEDQAEQIRLGFSTLHLHTIIPPDAKTARIILRDSSGRIGTSDVASSAIPNLKASSATMTKPPR